jgi:ribosomal protein S18 acetylase RimI-like enzyme
MRWEFQTESGDAAPKLSHSVFSKQCKTFLIDGLQSGLWSFWIAEIREEIVSHAFVQRISMVPNPNRIHDQWGYVTNCYTKPEYRSRGIGSALMRSLIQWARDIDLELLVVWPSHESIGYYKKLGFSEENEICRLSIRSSR